MPREKFESIARSLVEYSEAPKPNSVAAILNPHQLNVIRAIGKSWQTDNKGRVKEPTGGGKTVMQTAIVEGTGASTLIVVPRINLIHQTTREFRDRTPGITVTPYYGRRKDLSGQVNITTYPSWMAGVTRGDIDPTRYDLLLFDEAHHLLPPRRVATSQVFENSLQLGFTATPAYGKNKHLKDVLTAEISNSSIRQAVESNRLSSFSVYLAKTGIALNNVKVKEKEGEKEFDESWLQKAVNVASRNQAAVDIYKQAFMGKQTIAYCAGIDHARALAENFAYAGINAASVSGKQSEKVRQKILEQYKAGKIQVLCNADLLIEGFDDVKTSVILNLRPTLSPRLAEQRGGRALRLDRDDRSKYATIIDFIDDVKSKNQPVSFAQVAEAAQITNTWYLHKSGEYKGFIKPIILDLKGSKVLVDKKEVMWAVNEISGLDFEIEAGWKTLRRISAETGVPLDVLEILADTEGTLSDLIDDMDRGEPMHVKEIISPTGYSLTHFDDNATGAILNDVLHSLGYVIDEENTSITPQNLYRFDPLASKELTEIGKFCAKRLRNSDVEEIIKYAFKIWQRILNKDDNESGARVEQKTPTHLDTFKQEVIKTDGSLIPLKPTADEKKLFLQVRFFDIPALESDENINVTPYLLEQRSDFGMNRILLVDMYQQEQEKLIPIAHLDWGELTFKERQNTASARGNVHSYVIPKNDHEKLAKERWGTDSFSSRVEVGYERQGLGSLMLAVSGVALAAKGFKTFDSGSLTEKEARIYEKFNFPEIASRRRLYAPIEELIDNPQTNLAIEKFL